MWWVIDWPELHIQNFCVIKGLKRWSSSWAVDGNVWGGSDFLWFLKHNGKCLVTGNTSHVTIISQLILAGTVCIVMCWRSGVRPPAMEWEIPSNTDCHLTGVHCRRNRWHHSNNGDIYYISLRVSPKEREPSCVYILELSIRSSHLSNLESCDRRAVLSVRVDWMDSGVWTLLIILSSVPIVFLCVHAYPRHASVPPDEHVHRVCNYCSIFCAQPSSWES